MSFGSDPRVRWIKGICNKALSVPDAIFDSMLDQNETNPDGAASVLQIFLGSEGKVGQVVYFYSSQAEVVEEIEVPTEVFADEVSRHTEDGLDLVAQAEGGIDGGAAGGAGDAKEGDAIGMAGLEDPDAAVAPIERRKVIRIQKVSVRKIVHRCHIMSSVPPSMRDTLTLYFLRNVKGEIERPSGSGESMNKFLEWGVLSDESLINLFMLMREVFMPLLDPALTGAAAPAAAANATAVVVTSRTSKDKSKSRENDGVTGDSSLTGAEAEAPKGMDQMKNEFRGNLQKFVSRISHAIQQIKGEVYLNIPNIIITDPEAVLEDYEVISTLENALEDWSKSVASVVEQELRKVPLGKGPLAEVEFWRLRNGALSALFEQINLPSIQTMLRVLELIEAPMLATFKFHFAELSKLYIEAKDNVKFLTTLERHFKDISGGSFGVILDTLPSMMNAIRYVWIISGHYNTDERMVPLMERIAGEIADKVTHEINIKTILRKPPEIALTTIDEAKTVLENWLSTYMVVRERIERSGTDHRWEFDRKRLFEQSNYMARICENLSYVATALDEYHKFLGPELKAVTGDSAGIDEVMRRVESLIGPLESIPFDIFDSRYKTSWEAVMRQFDSSLSEIDEMSKIFIDTSFQKLRSAEGAFDLLQNFQNIQSRETINEQMMRKYKDILLQYTKELEVIQDIFARDRANPPVYKNFPPVAGAISWAKALYLRAKKPIMRFRTMTDLLKSGTGEEVKEKYLVFARSVDEYIKQLFNEWRAGVSAIATDNLKQPILGPRLLEIKGSGGEQASRVMPPPPYFVNFAPELSALIRESKYLDRLGFAIPETALNVTLQEEKYNQYVQELGLMLGQYSGLLRGLSPVETQLLQKQLGTLRSVLMTGFTPLNWNSQRIPHFLETCNRALSEFAGVVSQIHKSSAMIEEVVESIEAMMVVRESDFELGVVMEVSEFYEQLERNRLDRLEALVRKYRSIGPLLVKVEEMVATTNTGASPALAPYYRYWERRIFNAITKMIISSMATFQALLNVGTRVTSKDGEFVKALTRPPLCKIKATLNGRDIVQTPALTDIYKYLSKSVKHIVESSKLFVRWMDNTCRETEPHFMHEDEEPVIFSFYQDISQNPHVIKMMLNLNQAIHKVFSIVQKYLDSWRRYDNIYGLWNPKRRSALEKLAERKPSCVYFDTRLGIYAKLAESVRAQPTEKDIDFLRIDCYPVAVAIGEQADTWKADYGVVLLQLAGAALAELTEKMDRLEAELATDPKDLEQLKFVLAVIVSIAEDGLTMELAYEDVAERYRTLHRFRIDVPAEEAARAAGIAARWRQLCNDAKTKDLRLLRVKAQFREVTRNDAAAFLEDCRDIRRTFALSGPGSTGIDLDAGVEMMGDYQRLLAEKNKRRQELVNAESLFALPITSYPELLELQSELEKLDKVYALYSEQKDFVDTMSSMLWSELDMNAMIKGVEQLERKLRMFPKDLKGLSTFQAVEMRVLAFKDSIPLIQSLKNDAMKPRHWDRLMEVTGVRFEINPKTFTLANLFSMQLHRFGEAIGEIVNEALQEQKIEKQLQSIEEHWRQTALSMAKYKKNGEDRGWVLRSADDIKLELEDHMLNLQTMGASRFVGQFAADVRGWEKKLNLVNECLDVWFVVQRKWMYLESIFVGAEDIRLQLPEEAKKFDAIDKAFKAVMTATQKNPNVVDACTFENRIETLENLSERLDKCQKSLSEYLDSKRNAFPRFFFISDDELLSVLGSSDPSSIQVHLLKLFDNVKAMDFGRNNRFVNGMKSSENEGFKMRENAVVEGPVESWMTGVEEEMKSSLRQITKEGVFLYASEERTQWIQHVLGMVSLVGSQIWWTWEVEDVFRRVDTGEKYAMKELEAKLTGQLNDLVAMVRRPMDSLVRKKVNALLIIDVHARDIVDYFVRDSILNAKEFAWESQLRFYWDRDVDDIVIKQCTGTFRFGYEYMGLNGRLVITPLTDRCYMTITQALTFKLGGSPAGPAGTGKTETVKDLAKSLALPCFVINCGDGLDYKAMASTFLGLIQVGAWGCFDEFNRINIEVLSVVSAQLKAIQNALTYNKRTVDIGIGGEVVVKRTAGFATVGVFITMNPGYAGRTELPDNLKALFRPVTMITPDLLQICQIMLFSEGFEEATVLAKKMTVLYKLSREQLSKQYHYDFGLRALKSVLVMAGSLKRESSEMGEDLVLMRALRDSNMPKFVFEDVPLFRGLINDLFPGLDCPRVGYVALKSAIIQDLEENGYHHSDEEVFLEQVDKTIQMYETQAVRHTTMIVGPTNGGKTLVLDTLMRASLPALDVVVKMFLVNPKAQSVAELYGLMDPLTRDWTDGVLSKIFRELNQPLPAGKENEMRWILYDGDVDAVWVENMNSVMDDNKLLTLPNGERIRLQPYCAMIIETFDLQYASPATISRCGMVWVDPKNLGYRPYYERWLKFRCASSQKEAEKEVLIELFEKYVPKCVDFVLEGIVDGEIVDKLKQVIPSSNICMVKQLCGSLDAFLSEEKNVTDRSTIEGVYLFSIVWSIGASLLGDSRVKFDNFLKRITDASVPNEILYDYFFDTETRRWQAWSTLVVPYQEPVPFQFYKIQVPTTDFVLYTTLLDNMARTKKPILFVGESGTAKTVTIQNYLDSLDGEKNMILNMNFSSKTSSMDVQVNIDANVDKRTGSIYGPPAGKKLIIFLDDMNMPKVDVYGTQQPIALLHFLVGRGYMYDRKDLGLRTLKDLLYVGAMGPPGGGRNPVDPRFVAMFNVYNLTPPTREVLKKIYSSIVETFLREFMPPIIEAGKKVTDVTLKLYYLLIEKLPPTPSKFHYIFNLRDLSRVYEGMCLATPEKFSDTGSFLRLWRNEMNRIFCDRLTTASDKQIVDDLMVASLKETWSEHADYVMADPMVFGDFALAVGRIQEEKEDPRLYEDLRNYSKIRPIFEQVLDTYNVDHKPMTLVLFEMALEHLSRIHRIVRMPRGNALLVGVGGSGKQSLARLASFTAGHSLFEIVLARGYGDNEFREDLKELYRRLGTGSVTFLFTDAHVVQEGFLEFINNMLTTGMVPALFEQDEKDGLANSVRKEVKAAGILDSNENCWRFFIQKCLNNMHIVLAMSPSGDTLRVRCRNFPGLVSNAVIDWFFPWPADALEKVANYFLADEPLPEAHRANIIGHLVFAHQNVMEFSKRFELELRRHYYVTPKNYLDFISNYRKQLKDNNKKIQTSIKRLEGGLTKLIEAALAVDAMQIELTQKKIIVDEKTVNVEAMIVSITEKSSVATAQQAVATRKQTEVEEASVLINSEKEQADAALSEALPAVEAAAEALENLSKADLNEIKSFAQPPPLVKSVCVCVVFLKPTGQELDEDWKGCKTMLNNPNLLKLLKEYDKDKISDKMIKKVKGVFKENPEMTLDNMKSVSQAGHGLLTWVVAIVKYHSVARSVEPLKQKVRTMEKEQQRAERELADLSSMLEALNSEIGALSKAYGEANDELQGLKSQAALMEKRLMAASKLIAGLSSERSRWTVDVAGLKEQTMRLVGDCLLAASFLSYAGAFTFDYRADMIYGKFYDDVVSRSVPLTQPYKLEGLLTTDATVQKWVSEGLPADEHSVQNGILTTKSSRFPLCIDPQQQAVTWIKTKEAGSNLTVKTLNESDFMKHLELAIQFGNPFLFEAVDEELDPMLDPVLERNTFMQGTQKMIKLGDKVMEWDDNFRLYFTTKLANPHYSPEVMGKTMIINYSVTMQGLANQLLNVVVAHERPDLEKQYKALVDEMSKNTMLIVDLEDTLLRELSSSTGNILDNEDLIATLEETKSKAVEIGGKLEQAKFTREEITKARAVYMPVAKRGSILYFAISGLSNIMSMYEISLSLFLVVFNGSLSSAKRDVVLENRIKSMTNSVMVNMYDYTCTGIFERHKLMFSFQMTAMIMDGDGILNRPELDFFLKGDISLEGVSRPKPVGWLLDSGWKDLVCLAGFGGELGNLVTDLESNSDMWRQWYDLETPETEPLPMGYSQRLSKLQQLLVMRCYRPDRVYNSVKLFVMHQTGDKFVQPPVLDYARVYNQSSPSMPMVFILSPGADPQSDIQSLGDVMGFTGNKFKFLALGQGQGPLAEQMLEAGYTRGHWVLLNNCHLLTNWLKVLEKMLIGMAKPHKDFRLWLTTDPTDKFPLGILQRSLKVVTEPPDGLKLNMRSLYSKIDQEMLDECPNPSFRPLVYVLCFLHAVVLERRKYGKIGWNVNYDFNESDWNISRRLLGLYLAKAWEGRDEVLPWGSLKYLIGDAMYGGRVSDAFDRRILSTYLTEYMGDFLFDENQHFYFSRAGFDYDLPAPTSTLDEYREWVERLPLTNSPAVFGLHPNAEIGYLSNAAKSMWRDLIDLQPRSSGSGEGMSREDYIASIASDLQGKIPQQTDLAIVRKSFETLMPSPTQIVLLQELERWNTLVERMTLSLIDLQRALIGEIGMSDDLDKLGVALFNGFLPAMWRRLCPATQKPLGSWVVHFIRRYEQYMNWIEAGDPAVIWISGLHIPESYLTALVQTTCRMRNWPLDKSTLYTLVTKYESASEVPDKLESGCYVAGLYLEGAGWDIANSCLCRQEPKVLVTELPILQVIPIEASKLKLQNTFKTPVYVTQGRANAMGVGLVFEADLSTSEHISHWVLQGVALSLNVDT